MNEKQKASNNKQTKTQPQPMWVRVVLCLVGIAFIISGIYNFMLGSSMM